MAYVNLTILLPSFSMRGNSPHKKHHTRNILSWCYRDLGNIYRGGVWCILRDDCHAQIFLRLVANNSKERHTDYWAAYYILTCKHAIRVKTLEHIGRFIHWLGILNEDFSEEYQ